MICKKCGTELEDGARFCSHCGALQPIICPECGAESRPGSRVCSSCGKKLPVPVHDEPLVDYPKRKKSNAAKVAIVAIVVGALLLLLGALFALKSTILGVGEKKEPPQEPPVQEEQLEMPAEPEPVPDLTPEEPQAPAQPEPVPDLTPEEEVPAEPEEEPIPEEPEEQPQESTEEPPQQPGSQEGEAPTEEDPAPAEPKPEETETPRQTDGEWYFQDSDSRLLTDDDIRGMSAWELKVARNEIYARHGRRFKNQELQTYFDSRSWYNGTTAPADFDENLLNETERANANFLKAAE